MQNGLQQKIKDAQWAVTYLLCSKKGTKRENEFFMQGKLSNKERAFGQFKKAQQHYMSLTPSCVKRDKMDTFALQVITLFEALKAILP